MNTSPSTSGSFFIPSAKRAELEEKFNSIAGPQGSSLNQMQLKYLLQSLNMAMTHTEFCDLLKTMGMTTSQKFTFAHFLKVYRKLRSIEIEKEREAQVANEKEVVDVAAIGVRGAAQFFEQQASALQSNNDFYSQLQEAKLKKKKEEEERLARRNAFEAKKAFFEKTFGKKDKDEDA